MHLLAHIRDRHGASDALATYSCPDLTSQINGRRQVEEKLARRKLDAHVVAVRVHRRHDLRKATGRCDPCFSSSIAAHNILERNAAPLLDIRICSVRVHRRQNRLNSPRGQNLPLAPHIQSRQGHARARNANGATPVRDKCAHESTDVRIGIQVYRLNRGARDELTTKTMALWDPI